jgi:hypothetical protein
MLIVARQLFADIAATHALDNRRLLPEGSIFTV